MKRVVVGLFALTAVMAIAITSHSQSPDGKDKKGDKKGPPRFELGKVLPPFVREGIELTSDQEKQIEELEKLVKEKLSKILTGEQKKQIETLRPKGPEGKDKKDEKEGKRKKDQPDDKDTRKPVVIEELEQLSSISIHRNLIRNSPLLQSADGFVLKDDAQWVAAVHPAEYSPSAVAFRSGSAKNGSISQDVTGFEKGIGRWFRFSFRGLAENDFAVKNDALFLKVEFFGKKGTNSLDGVSRKIYSQIERDRRELGVNGNQYKNGAAVWKSYALDFNLPFAEIDLLRVSVGFENGTSEREASFYVTDLTLVPIPNPSDAPKVVKTAKGFEPSREKLIHLGGRWYYDPEPGMTAKPARLIVDAKNAHRLYYRDSRLSNPFAENMTAWMRKGYRDITGQTVEADRFLPDNVVIEFADDTTMIVRAKNIPNHPTAIFPGRPGPTGSNPSYIQEHNYTYYLPLNPVCNPKAIAMDKTNSNRALPMGATGLAINGVVFYNPFDAGNMDAHNMMDRCCGHPSPDNRYHYHKYPVCVKSPFVDEGDEHSPLIGFAFDGFPIYGPYESKGLMAKDDKTNLLNEFNIHFDEVRGWHYHATPGRYPYLIGGYFGEVDRRNGDRKGPKK